MKYHIKKLVQTFLRSCGLELVRYSGKHQKKLLEISSLSFRELVVWDAMVKHGGEITLQEARFLAKLVKSIQGNGPIIEIGTLFGKSTFVLLLEKHKNQRLISVDNYSWNPLGINPDLHFDITKALLSEGTEKYNLYQKRIGKNEFYAAYDEDKPSLVFCDADHSYEETSRDIEWAQKVGAEIICGHDYHAEHFPEVVRAVDESGGPKILVEKLWVL